MRDFPCGPTVKDLPCNAMDTGSILGWGTKIPYATEQRSPCVPATEAVCSNKRSRVMKRRSRVLQPRPNAVK